MKYYISPIISNAGGQISFFNTVMVRWPSNTRNPSYGTNPDKVWLPVGIRADDCFLGACWMASDKNLHPFFSADVHPDGFPFPDRTGCGLAFMPRAHIKDFPDAKTGRMIHDRRVGYIRCPDGHIVILGGDSFRAEAIPTDHWANFHHKFIDITGRSLASLKSVTDEPAEIARRPPPKSNSALRLDDAVSRFDAAYEILSRAIEDKSYNNLADAFDPLSSKNRRLVLDNIPTRGYDHAIPTFELLSHAMPAGDIHYEATIAWNAQSKSSVECRRNLVHGIDARLNDLNERTDLMAMVFAAELRVIRDELFANLTDDNTFRTELDRTLANIPSAGCILGTLPETLIPSEDRELAGLAAKAVPFTNIGMEPVDGYCFPIEKQGAKQIDQLLMKLLNVPQEQAMSNTKSSDDLATGSCQEPKRKGRENHSDDEDYPPHPDGKWWKYTYERLAGETKQQANRHVCKTLKMPYTGLSTNDDYTAAIEKYVNTWGLGLSSAGRQFGTMVDRV